jgi:outer membrane protein TolC
MRPDAGKHLARTAALLALSAATLVAQPATQPATGSPLDGLVAEALERNLGLAAHRAADERAEAVVRETRGLLLPNVTLDTRRSRLRNTIDLGDFVNPAYAALNGVLGAQRFPTDLSVSQPFAQETRLRVAQPLLAPQAAAAQAVSRAARDVQGAELRRAARQLAAEVQLAYLGWASAARAAEIHESTLGLVDAQLRTLERALKAGTVTPDAVLRARADRAEVEQTLAEARERAAAAARALNQLRARPLDAPIAPVADSLLLLPLDSLPNAYLASAAARREELRQADGGVRAARARERLAAATFLPTIAVGFDYGLQGADYGVPLDRGYRVLSVVASWNLVNGGQDRARRQEAVLDGERARLQRAELSDLVALQVTNAFEAARVARASIATAEERLAAASRTFELVQRRWAQGLATQLELLDARTAFTRASLNGALARHTYAARWVELERAAALRAIPVTPNTEDRP